MSSTARMSLAAMLLALALVLPFLTGQIPAIGSMLLPMHIPVLLCGFLCGWQYGLIIGFAAPLMRMMLFGMPPLLVAISMSFELAAYGFFTGFLWEHSRWKCTFSVIRVLVCAMIAGRIAWAAIRIVLAGLGSMPFSWSLFIAGAFVQAVPGIILQLILIPALMLVLKKAHLVHFTTKKETPCQAR